MSGSRRWSPAVAVGGVVAAFLAGLPLLELVTASPLPPAIERPTPGREVNTPARVVTVTPAAGWEAVSEADKAVLLRDGAVSFSVEVSAGADCRSAESAAVEAASADEPSVPEAGHPYRTESLVGTARIWSGPTTDGLLFVACEDGSAVSVLATGPSGSYSSDELDAVSEMLGTIEVP